MNSNSNAPDPSDPNHDVYVACDDCQVDIVPSVDEGVTHRGGIRYDLCERHQGRAHEHLTDAASDANSETVSADLPNGDEEEEEEVKK